MEWEIGQVYNVGMVGDRSFEGEFVNLDFDPETRITWYTFKVLVSPIGTPPIERHVNSEHIVFVDIIRTEP